MSSLAQEIHYDEQEYIRLCRKYNEPVQYNHGPDCYGEHAKKLKQKYNQEKGDTI